MLDRHRSFDAIPHLYDASRFLPPDRLRAALGVGLHSLGLPAGSRLLDCGCGTGQLLLALVDLHYEPVGIDPSIHSLAIAQQKVGSHVPLYVGDGAHLPFADASFQAVVIAHVLEHVPDWQAVLAESFRVCDVQGGLIFLFSPGFVRNEPRRRLAERLHAAGQLPPRPGVASQADLMRHFEGQGIAIGAIRSDDWAWVRRVPIRDSLDALERRVYSRFWAVPDTAYRSCLSLVYDEFRGREEEVEEINAAIELLIVRHPAGVSGT